jgi:hypothetical protein
MQKLLFSAAQLPEFSGVSHLDGNCCFVASCSLDSSRDLLASVLACLLPWLCCFALFSLARGRPAICWHRCLHFAPPEFAFRCFVLRSCAKCCARSATANSPLTTAKCGRECLRILLIVALWLSLASSLPM